MSRTEAPARARHGGPEPGGSGAAHRRGRPAPPAWLPRWLAWAAVCTVAGAVLFLCYLQVSRTQPAPADGASNALEAWDMLHGNVLLHGWTLTDVSFYTTELPEYTLVEAVRGLRPDVVHVAAALTYTLLVLLAGLLARGRATGREGVIRFLAASGIMLAPQLGPGVDVVLLSPDHIGTGVPLLLTFLVLDRAPRRWYLPPVIGLMLAWVLIADQIALIDAVLPLVAVCAGRACYAVVRHRRWRWFELSLAAAAISAVAVASLTLRLISGLGGFSLRPVITSVAPLAWIPSHLRLTARGLLALFGADFSGLHPGAQAFFAAVHLAGVAAVVSGLGLAVWRFRRADLVSQVLTVAIAVSLAAYVLSVIPSTFYDTREIGDVLPFGAVLAARMLGGRILASRAGGTRGARSRAGRIGAVSALGALGVCYAAALGYGAARPPVPAVDQDLAGWLAAHHLVTGLSMYTWSNITTLDSGGRVQLRTVSWGPRSAAPRAYQSQASWYDPRLHYASYVMTTTAGGPRSSIPPGDVVADFGKPARIYHFRDYTIMIWHKNLLAGLGPPRTAPFG
ncbi:MAG: hypothetical protein JOY82_12825 [Streptosporangiaceae bacterium]|nr:hypothetical protein [Streptosporangiaceae bacterium]